MGLFFHQLLTLLITSPGNLVYHVVLVFSVAGALQAAIVQLRSGGFPQAKRTVFGLSLLLGVQLILFVISAIGLTGWLNLQLILPALDRAAVLISLVWIIWLWAFPEPLRPADAGALALSLLVLIFFGVTLALWEPLSGSGFNQTGLETAWQACSLLVALFGLGWLAWNRPNGWGNGMAILLLAFLGHLLSLVGAWRLTGDYPGFVRLAQLVMYPLLLTLPQRFPAAAGEATQVRKERPRGKNEPSPERRRYSTDPKTFHALMALAAEDQADKVGQALTRAIAQAMLADLCFLVKVGTEQSITISAGYDLIREENLSGAVVDKDSIPLLYHAIQHGRPLRLPASSTSTDLKGLGKALSMPNPGHLLSVPIHSANHQPMGCILVLSPYSNRLWSADDQIYLTNVSKLLIPILERGQRFATLETELENARAQEQAAEQHQAETAQKAEEVQGELQSLHEKENQTEQQSQKQSESMTAAAALQEEAQKTIEKLRAENMELRQSGLVLPGGMEQLERELREALEGQARMQNALAQANIKIMEMEEAPSTSISSEQVEVIASISQELRQPMSSIVGYTDLLLGESVGILGALQRKFIERIKASTERVGGLVDDLIQITNLDSGKREFKPEPIDLNLIIDNAMAYTSTQIREKNITLRLDIPESTPHVQTDRDALQQILIHLLQNATSVTQTEGTITLRVQMQKAKEEQYLSLQVTDTGGGIASEDIPRVFARRYRAEHSLIQGLGDTGVGLSIAKALVEAQNGRIWVETEAGVGSTFSALLPVQLEEEAV
jgi:signal transduction histidine kinase